MRYGLRIHDDVARAARGLSLLVAVAVVLASCAGPPTPREGAPADSGRSIAPKRLVAAIMGDPGSLSSTVNPTGSGAVPGVNVVEGMVHAGLVNMDHEGKAFAQLAEAVPTTENGFWTVFPDGRMETVWKIRPAARWHDGVPFTSADIRFTAQLAQDRELAVFRNIAFDAVGRVEAPDDQTVRVYWKRPFIEADTLFSRAAGFPLPKHLLEQAYTENKSSIVHLPHWSEEFVGAGPFRLREWVRGSHLVLEANHDYALGRPKIDEVELRFVPDSNTLLANVLASAVELTLGRNISLDQALLVREQWKDGTVEISLVGWNGIYPQLLNPNPAAIADVQFRRALLHGIDRQQMVDTLQSGLVPIAHVFIGPDDPAYKAVEPSIVRYDHDPRRALQMIEALGYGRAADGAFRDAAGQRLSVEIRTSGGDDLAEKILLSVADSWQRIGVGASPVVVPRQLDRDPEYRATFPGFTLLRQPNDLNYLRRVHGAQTPLPETNFVGNNRSRYRNPEFDALIDSYFTTVPTQERLPVLGQIVHHMTDRLNVMGLFYHTVPLAIGKRVKNVTAPKVADAASQSWNAHEWDVT